MNSKTIRFQGDTLLIDYQIERGSPGSYAPADLTDASVTWRLGKQPTDEAAVLEKTIDDGITVVDAAAGKLRLLVLPGESAALSGEYWHQLRIAFAGGEVRMAHSGWLTIREAI